VALRSGVSVAPPAAAAGQPCGGLGRAVARAFREGKPQILVLGPLCGESVVFLAGRGARVHVDAVELPEPIPARQAGAPVEEVRPIRIDQPAGAFDLVLAWEMLDFVPPDRLQEFGSEIVRVLRVGGQLVLFAHLKPPSDRAVLPRYRLLADDLIVREEPATPPIPRYVHSNLMLERAIAGMSVQNIHLQRSQMREILASKAGVG
jgi:hypothetical protein